MKQENAKEELNTTLAKLKSIPLFPHQIGARHYAEGCGVEWGFG